MLAIAPDAGGIGTVHAMPDARAIAALAMRHTHHTCSLAFPVWHHQSSDSRDRCLWQSYNTGRDDMNKKLNQVTQAVRVPKSTWFVLGSLLMIGLYLFHALFSRN